MPDHVIVMTLHENGKMSVYEPSLGDMGSMNVWPEPVNQTRTAGRHCFHISVSGHVIPPPKGCVVPVDTVWRQAERQFDDERLVSTATCGNELPCKIHHETDGQLRMRILDAYGMWGAFASEVVESSGSALDDLAKQVGLVRGKAC